MRASAFYHPFMRHSSQQSQIDGVLLVDKAPGMTIGVTGLRPTSQGSIHIQSADPLAGPSIRPNFLATPQDQQLPLPKGPMEVVLSGFTADGPRQFMLPHFEAPVHVFPKRGDREDHVATLDTIVFEPDLGRFTMSWRVARPLKKSMHEIAQVLVGKKGKDWWQKREQVAFPIPVVMVPMHKPKPKEAAPA